MSYRAWIVAIALGLIAVSGEAQSPSAGGEERADDQQQPTYELPTPFPVQIIEDDKAADTRERREQESEQREKDDLIAQQSMEVAAHSAKLAAWLSLLVVTIGTALLIWTLILTRQANKAAQNAVTVTREVARDQSRAYVHVKSVQWLETGPDFKFTMFIANSGNTPAKRFLITVEVGSCAYGSLPPSTSAGQTRAEKGWNALPGGEVFQVGIVPRAVPNFDTIARRDTEKEYIFLRGTVRYTTIYDETFLTEFSFMGRGVGKPQPNYAEYGSLGTKMSRTLEDTKAFAMV